MLRLLPVARGRVAMALEGLSPWQVVRRHVGCMHVRGCIHLRAGRLSAYLRAWQVSCRRSPVNAHSTGRASPISRRKAAGVGVAKGACRVCLASSALACLELLFYLARLWPDWRLWYIDQNWPTSAMLYDAA